MKKKLWKLQSGEIIAEAGENDGWKTKHQGNKINQGKMLKLKVNNKTLETKKKIYMACEFNW